MFLSAKSQGFFFAQNEHAVLLARTSTAAAPMLIEELKECPPGDAAALSAAVRELQNKKSPSGYLHAHCGLCPARRLVRQATLEAKRLKEPAYLTEVVSSQFRVEPDKYLLAILNAGNGAEFDQGRAAEKEVVFCGAMLEELDSAQDRLLEAGIYPERMEIGTVATLGAAADYLAFKQIKTPALLLEVGADATQSFIVSAEGVQASRPIPHGLDSMVPVIQKELSLKDEESAKKLFYSNTFDFTGMGGLLIKKLLKELQSSIGFHEVQTGQSIAQVICMQLPPKLAWLEATIAGALGVGGLKIDYIPWLESHQITFANPIAAQGLDARWFGLFSLMATYDAVSA